MNYKVVVNCCTYNQSKFIIDCMDGFCMQQTNFPFVCTIIDDASTDGEQEVISDYLNDNFDLKESEIAYQKETSYAFITFARHKINKNCYFAVLLLKYNHYNPEGLKKKSEYVVEWQKDAPFIAICEGDDYWTKADKLQKQVDALEANPNARMVYTDYSTVDEQGQYIYRKEYEEIYKPNSKSGDILPELFARNFPMTLTTMYRQDIFKSELYKKAPACLDYLYCMVSAFLGDCIYIPENMANYRFNPNSLMNTQLEKVVSIVEMLKHYFALEYVSGNVKKVSAINHYRIMKTIMLKYVDNNKIIDELIFLNKDVKWWFIWFNAKVKLYRLTH